MRKRENGRKPQMRLRGKEVGQPSLCVSLCVRGLSLCSHDGQCWEQLVHCAPTVPCQSGQASSGILTSCPRAGYHRTLHTPEVGYYRTLCTPQAGYLCIWQARDGSLLGEHPRRCTPTPQHLGLSGIRELHFSIQGISQFLTKTFRGFLCLSVCLIHAESIKGQCRLLLLFGPKALPVLTPSTAEGEVSHAGLVCPSQNTDNQDLCLLTMGG